MCDLPESALCPSLSLSFTILELARQSPKVSIIIVSLCVHLLPICDSVTGLLTTQEVWPLFVYFSLDTGFLSALGLPPHFQRKGPAASEIKFGQT